MCWCWGGTALLADGKPSVGRMEQGLFGGASAETRWRLDWRKSDDATNGNTIERCALVWHCARLVRVAHAFRVVPALSRVETGTASAPATWPWLGAAQLFGKPRWPSGLKQSLPACMATSTGCHLGLRPAVNPRAGRTSWQAPGVGGGWVWQVDEWQGLDGSACRVVALGA